MSVQMAGVPMPRGWEARYNESFQRYYFLDHASKVTTWDDPRLTDAGIWDAGAQLMLSDLKRVFADATQDTIKKAMVVSNMDRAATEQRLKHEGYHAVVAKERTPPAASGSSQQQGRSPAPRRSPDFAKVGASSAQQQRADEQAALDDAKYKLQGLKEMFLDVSDVVLEDALTNCNNDLVETAKYLREMGCKAGDYSHMGSAIDVRPQQQEVDHQQVKYRLQIEYPDIPTDEVDKMYDELADEAECGDRLAKITTLKKDYPRIKFVSVLKVLEKENYELEAAKAYIDKRLAAMKKDDSPGPPSASKRATPAGGSPSKQSVRSVSPAKRTVVMVGGAEPRRMSRSLARGPDASLRRGADPANRLCGIERTEAMGPDGSLARGADPALRKGPMPVGLCI